MNKFLIVIWSLLVIKLTVEVIDAVTVGTGTTNTQVTGIKRYVLINIHFNLYFCFCFNSMILQQVKRKCNSTSSKYHCHGQTRNTRRKKRSTVTTPPPEVLNDEDWGVRISIFLIFTMKFSILFHF